MRKFDETADVHSKRNDEREPWLVISSANGVRAVPLPRSPRVTIGRMHTCDIVIDDESVSRQHAAITSGPHGLSIEDLGSRNKTKITGRALSRGETAPLPAGAVVEVGYATMFVQLGRPAGAAGGIPAPPSSKGAVNAIVHDPTMQRLYALLDVIAPSPLNVLILGETGTGKEVFAEAIHKGSARSSAPFLKINCAALSGSLLESELFGHERGAFTGAQGAKAGLFEAADSGTVFLDEVGELPLETQAKLLRVVEYGEVFRLGSIQPRRVDVRYVAATNRDLSAAIAANRFRADLFFRLNGFSVTLPPLRKRLKDIQPLARHFLDRAARGRPYTLTVEAQTAIEHYAWPGNVRELKNILERAFVLSGPPGRIEPMHLQLPETSFVDSGGWGGNMADPRGDREQPNMMPSGVLDTIPPTPYGAAGTTPATWPPIIQHGPGSNPPPLTGYSLGHAPGAPPFPLPMTPAMGVPAAIPGGNDLRAQRESWEKQQILQALERTSGNQKEAAKLLGVSRRTLINKIEAYGIARPRKRP
jgi:two-component system, NtrC family, response regulator AtoC